jgi:serine/threonine protein kinase
MDRPSFFELMRRSHLLSKRRLVAIAKEFRMEPPEEIVRQLIERKWLSRFQARQILSGRASGLKLGHYRLLRQIGAGSVGVVYKAYHDIMGRVVALKVVKEKTRLPDVCGRQLFRREVRATSRLNHPNIVAVYDANHSRGVDYLAMEYIKGPDLRRLVGKRGPLPIGLACELMRQAAETLQYAQSVGMVHCDIKPSNLLVQKTTRWELSAGSTAMTTFRAPMLKILDFGLAQVKGGQLLAPGADLMETAKPGSVWGTLDFMSPEQLNDLHDVDVRSDLYSLGCTFYYVLTGEVPFPGTTETEKLVYHATAEPAALDQLRPEVPGPIVRIFARLLAKDRNERFATPLELAHELAPWCNVEKIAAPTRVEYASSRTVSDIELGPESQTQAGFSESTEIPPVEGEASDPQS